MSRFIAKVRRKAGIGLANALSGTHFFGVKRALLRFADIAVGEGTRVVGPLHMGTAASLSIGANTWIGRNLNIEGNGNVSIGDNVDIAPYCVFSTGGHHIGGPARRAGSGVSFDQAVGDGCWIGIRSTFVNDANVGSGSVVAAGAVVIGDVPANAMAGGVPAKVLKTFDDGAE